MSDELDKTVKDSSDLKDIVIIFSVIIFVLVAASMLDIFQWMRVIAANPEGFRIVELFFVLMLFGFAYSIFARRRAKSFKMLVPAYVKEIEELQDNVNRLRSTVDLSPDTITVHRDGNYCL